MSPFFLRGHGGAQNLNNNCVCCPGRLGSISGGIPGHQGDGQLLPRLPHQGAQLLWPPSAAAARRPGRRQGRQSGAGRGSGHRQLPGHLCVAHGALHAPEGPPEKAQDHGPLCQVQALLCWRLHMPPHRLPSRCASAHGPFTSKSSCSPFDYICISHNVSGSEEPYFLA